MKFHFETFFYSYFYQMRFWVKTPYFFKWLYKSYYWNMPRNEKKVYLTFDDGPTPEITNWVLSQLKEYNTKATFFCIGDNIKNHPEILKNIIDDHHSIGNHTFNHLNGWKTTSEKYLENFKLCQSEINYLQSINSNLFRPPYGKIKNSQAKAIQNLGYKIIMWDIISYDFDNSLSKEKCLQNVISNIENGSIIVFHDSVKAWGNLEYVLPKTLQFLNENGYKCEAL